MWKNISKEHQHYKNQKRKQKISKSLHLTLNATTKGSTDPEKDRSFHHYSVDCTHANTGLFTGIFLLVLVIISIVVFFVMIHSKDDELYQAAIMTSSLSELVLYCISTLAVIIGMIQVTFNLEISTMTTSLLNLGT